MIIKNFTSKYLNWFRYKNNFFLHLLKQICLIIHFQLKGHILNHDTFILVFQCFEKYSFHMQQINVYFKTKSRSCLDLSTCTPSASAIITIYSIWPSFRDSIDLGFKSQMTLTLIVKWPQSQLPSTFYTELKVFNCKILSVVQLHI